MFTSTQKLTVDDMLRISQGIGACSFKSTEDLEKVITAEDREKIKNGVEDDTFILTLFDDVQYFVGNPKLTSWLGDLLSDCPKITTFKLDMAPGTDMKGLLYYEGLDLMKPYSARPFSEEVITLGETCFCRIKTLSVLDLQMNFSFTPNSMKKLAATFVQCPNLTTLKLPNCGLWEANRDSFNIFFKELSNATMLTRIDVSREREHFGRWDTFFWQGPQFPEREFYYQGKVTTFNDWPNKVQMLSSLCQINFLRITTKILQSFDEQRIQACNSKKRKSLTPQHPPTTTPLDEEPISKEVIFRFLEFVAAPPSLPGTSVLRPDQVREVGVKLGLV